MAAAVIVATVVIVAIVAGSRTELSRWIHEENPAQPSGLAGFLFL